MHVTFSCNPKYVNKFVRNIIMCIKRITRIYLLSFISSIVNIVSRSPINRNHMTSKWRAIIRVPEKCKKFYDKNRLSCDDENVTNVAVVVVVVVVVVISKII